MALINATAIPNADDYELEQSLRFNDDDSPYLTFQPSSASNRKTYTFSFWFKRATQVNESPIFTSNQGHEPGFNILFGGHLADDFELNIYDYTSGSANIHLRTTQKFRDSSAWYHIVVAVDTTQGTAANRAKIYVNGNQITDFATETYPSQNLDTNMNNPAQQSGKTWSIGSSTERAQYADGYLSEFNFIDGAAKAPADFGETGDYGEWKPIEYSGTYGTNGFYLPFKNDYSVEGFSAITYRGGLTSSESDTTSYVGGVGFSSDMIWIKGINIAENHSIHDTVRGVSVGHVRPDTTNLESAGEFVIENKTDGFSFNGGYNSSKPWHQQVNSSTYNYVAWNWQMGNSHGVPVSLTANGDAQHSTAQYKTGSSSMLFDGSGDYIAVPDKDDFDFVERDFTMEWWQYRTGTVGSGVKRGIWRHANGNTYAPTITDDEGTMRIYLSSNNSSWNLANGLSIGSTEANAWHHYAVVREQGVFKTYKNGTLVTYYDGNNGAVYKYSGEARFGSSGSNHFEGYLDEFRISNKARYNSNFTPSTTAFTNDNNTVLLIQSNTSNGSTTFIDSSGATPNTSGGITSNVSANPTYGQSIVSYTGSGSATTVGHGLSSAPEMIMVKSRTDAQHWSVYHASAGNQYGFRLNENGAQIDYPYWNDTTPTSSVFSIGGNDFTNKSSSNFIAYCFHSVTGYSKFGSYTGNGSSTGPSVTLGFAPAFLVIKRSDSSQGWNIWDNVRDNTNPNNTILEAHDSPTEVSHPNYNIDFTTTGFQIKSTYAGTNTSGGTYIYMAFADKREYAYWLDQSGNNNDWTSNNLTESDISVDSPTNNFATFNPLFRYTTAINDTYSQGNLKVEDNAGHTVAVGTIPMTSGKWYWEVFCLRTSYSGSDEYGMFDPSLNIPSSTGSTPADVGTGGYFYSGSGWTKANGSYVANPGSQASIGEMDIIAFAYDVSAATFKIYVNNVLQKTLTVAAQASYIPSVGNSHPSYSIDYIANFGQDSSFAGNRVSQGNQDSNEIGDFYYTPPSGYLALCTKNLPDVDVVPSEHFNTVLWTGNGSTQSITGVGFEPNFSWIKSRSIADSHHIFDSVRGAGYRLRSDSQEGENYSGTHYLTAFNSDGFALGGDDGVNKNTATYAAWNWKANGSGSSNTDGSITSTVSANVDAGFSIVGYTGTASNATVGHGLSKAPEMVIAKNRSDGSYWIVGTDDLTSWSRYIPLNLTNAETNAPTQFNSTAPTSTVFSIGTNADVNGSGHNIIAYCFHSVDGYSKVGSYTGNGATGATGQGPFVYLGFRPAFVMIKRSSSSSAYTNWVIYDSKRDGWNQGAENVGGNKYLYANSSAAEANLYIVNTFSNGFTMYDNYDVFNKSGETHIYLAFASVPFKYSNAR